jgi:protein ImuB
LELFSQKPRRDKAAADRALARVRAELGEDAVVKSSLRDGHLPEARFAFVPMHSARPTPSTKETRRSELDDNRCLVRRIYTKPIPLQARPVVGPGGCHFLGMGDDPAVRLAGPYIISGGWWNHEIHREYYFATAKTGRVLWVYFDRRRRCWFLHGEVE